MQPNKLPIPAEYSSDKADALYRAPKDKEENAVIEVDMHRSEQVRRWWPFLRDRRIDEFSSLAERFIDNEDVN